MVLVAKQTGTIHSRTGDDKDKLKANFDEGHMETFADLAENGTNPEFGALVYQMQNLSNDIDALRQFSGSEEKGRIDANATNITVANGNITTNTADIVTNRNNIPPLTIQLPTGYTLDVRAILVPPAKGAKKATVALTWTVTDTTQKLPITYTGTHTLI